MTTMLVFLAALSVHPVFYTNHNYFYKITGRDPLIFGATNGGLVEYNTATGAYRSLNNADGLTMNRLNCVGLDSSGAIWTGSENGICHVDPGLKQASIYPVDCVPCSRIHALLCRKDTVIFGTGNGVLRLETLGTPDDFNDDLRLEIYDTDGLPSNNITALAGNDRIWVGTDAGLARCTKDFIQIEVYTVSHGLLDNYINCVASQDTLVLVGTRNGLNRYHAGRFDTLLTGLAVQDIEISGDTVMLALDSLRQVGIYYAGALQVYNSGLPWLVRVNDLVKINDTWVAGLGNSYEENYFGEGLGLISFTGGTPSWALNQDHGLPSNHISDICCGDSGVFVALGARDNVSRGIGWLKNDGSWMNFTVDSILPSNHIHRCETAPDGKAWFAMNPISNSGPDTMLCFSLDPATGSWRFLRTRFLDSTYNTDAVWDIKFDPAGNMYLEIGRPSNRLWVVDAPLAHAYAIEPIQPGFYEEIAIDTSGRIWRSIADDPGGLVMTNTHHTLFETSDDDYYIYSMNDGLLSNYVRGCVVDDDNNLYIATDAGLSVYNGQRFENYTGFSSAEPFDVARGADGRIWILTRSGIYYLDPFYKTIQGWTFGELAISLEFITESKEVIQIQGFAFDARRGCFWIGGSNGLLKLEIVHNDSLPLDRLVVYPNPAVQGQVVRIKNLPPDAVISVFSVSGRCLAKEITPDPTFGEVLWRIPAGTPSGLYFALIRTDRGKRIAKFAIVR
jgi:hypothetical protein